MDQNITVGSAEAEAFIHRVRSWERALYPLSIIAYELDRQLLSTRPNPGPATVEVTEGEGNTAHEDERAWLTLCDDAFSPIAWAGFASALDKVEWIEPGAKAPFHEKLRHAVARAYADPNVSRYVRLKIDQGQRAGSVESEDDGEPDSLGGIHKPQHTPGRS